MSDNVPIDLSEDHLQELLVSYVLEQLSEPERQNFEQILQQHLQLQAEVDQLRAVLGTLAHTSRFTPSPQLRQRVLAIAELAPDSAAPTLVTPMRTPVTTRVKGAKPQRRLWPILGAAIAALALGWLVVDNILLRQQLHRLETAFNELGERETHKFELKGSPAASTASASVLLDIETGKALVGVRNLPPLKPGEIYRLWAFTADKKILCGEFNTLPSGELISFFPLPLKEYTSEIKFMRISREAHTNPHRPETRVMVLSSET